MKWIIPPYKAPGSRRGTTVRNMLLTRQINHSLVEACRSPILGSIFQEKHALLLGGMGRPVPKKNLSNPTKIVEKDCSIYLFGDVCFH